MQPVSEQMVQDGRLLANRLERLSADSIWSHRASGLRGALLRCLEVLEPGSLVQHSAAGGFDPVEIEQARRALPALLEDGQLILEQAAKAIRTPDTQFD